MITIITRQITQTCYGEYDTGANLGLIRISLCIQERIKKDGTSGNKSFLYTVCSLGEFNIPHVRIRKHLCCNTFRPLHNLSNILRTIILVSWEDMIGYNTAAPSTAWITLPM